MLFENKISQANAVIERALKDYQRPYLSMSWGKDSIFLLFLVKKYYPDIPVIYVNSGYALPDSYAIRDRLVKEWNLNYHEIQQQVDYIEMCKIIGLPHERSRQDHKNAIKTIKKNVLDDFAIDHGFDLCFWGIRCEESKGRTHLFMTNNFFVASTQINKCHPIALFSINELWYLIDEYKIPMNEIYNKTRFLRREQIRNTGWVSTDGAASGKIQWLKYYYSDYFNRLMAEFPEIRAYV